ncbi:MAG TPA: hypothetical protein VLJ86_27310 [Ramlibacter sp.]|nr:hypothetical protein [Ramlibacter sp.]
MTAQLQQALTTAFESDDPAREVKDALQACVLSCPRADESSFELWVPIAVFRLLIEEGDRGRITCLGRALGTVTRRTTDQGAGNTQSMNQATQRILLQALQDPTVRGEAPPDRLLRLIEAANRTSGQRRGKPSNKFSGSVKVALTQGLAACVTAYVRHGDGSAAREGAQQLGRMLMKGQIPGKFAASIRSNLRDAPATAETGAALLAAFEQGQAPAPTQTGQEALKGDFERGCGAGTSNRAQASTARQETEAGALGSSSSSAS